MRRSATGAAILPVTSLVSSTTRRPTLNCTSDRPHRLLGDPVGCVPISGEIDDDPYRVVGPALGLADHDVAGVGARAPVHPAAPVAVLVGANTSQVSGDRRSGRSVAFLERRCLEHATGRLAGLGGDMKRPGELEDLVSRPPEQTEGRGGRDSHRDRGDDATAGGHDDKARRDPPVSAAGERHRPSAACSASTGSRRRQARTGEPAVASDGDLSQMTVSPGAANAGATSPSRSSPATTDPTACTQPDPLACATPVQTNNNSAVPATGPKARSGSARWRTRALAGRLFPARLFG